MCCVSSCGELKNQVFLGEIIKPLHEFCTLFSLARLIYSIRLIKCAFGMHVFLAFLRLLKNSGSCHYLQDSQVFFSKKKKKTLKLSPMTLFMHLNTKMNKLKIE